MKKTWFFDPHFCAFSKNLCSIWRKRGCTRQKTTNTGWSACTISVKQKKPGAISNFRFFKILIFRFFQGCHCIVVCGSSCPQPFEHAILGDTYVNLCFTKDYTTASSAKKTKIWTPARICMKRSSFALPFERGSNATFKNFRGRVEVANLTYCQRVWQWIWLPKWRKIAPLRRFFFFWKFLLWNSNAIELLLRITKVRNENLKKLSGVHFWLPSLPLGWHMKFIFLAWKISKFARAANAFNFWHSKVRKFASQ